MTRMDMNRTKRPALALAMMMLILGAVSCDCLYGFSSSRQAAKGFWAPRSNGPNSRWTIHRGHEELSNCLRLGPEFTIDPDELVIQPYHEARSTDLLHRQVRSNQPTIPALREGDRASFATRLAG